jgi:transmembrane 9 superfamily member 2/4
VLGCRYVQLCAEDYLWWWRSFHRGGAIACYLLVYAFVFLYISLPSRRGLSIIHYLSYMTGVVLAVHLCMGTVGFLSSALFVYSIFSVVKSDCTPDPIAELPTVPVPDSPQPLTKQAPEE